MGVVVMVIAPILFDWHPPPSDVNERPNAQSMQKYFTRNVTYRTYDTVHGMVPSVRDMGGKDACMRMSSSYLMMYVCGLA